MTPSLRLFDPDGGPLGPDGPPFFVRAMADLFDAELDRVGQAMGRPEAALIAAFVAFCETHMATYGATVKPGAGPVVTCGDGFTYALVPRAESDDPDYDPPVPA